MAHSIDRIIDYSYNYGNRFIGVGTVAAYNITPWDSRRVFD